MVLSGQKIRELVQNGKLIENYNIDNVHSSSYDVTVFEYILKFREKKEAISLIDKVTLDDMYQKVNISGGYNLKPGECILVPLKENFKIPANICGHIRGRTSFNRLGLFVTFQHLNPGYEGKLNITIVNNSKNTYIIMPNINIAQVVFEYLDKDVSDELLYCNEKSPSYQFEDGMQGTKIYDTFIGKVVRHFKGNYYYIENICLDSEEKEPTIIYRTLYDREDSNIWTRPAKMFFEPIDENRPDNVTHQKNRFVVVDDLTIDYTKINRKD